MRLQKNLWRQSTLGLDRFQERLRLASYLITGIAGFIGSTLAHELVAQGHTVRGIDNLSTGRMENLQDILPHIDFRVADLRDADAMRSACEGTEFILHQAALASVPRSVKDPLTSHQYLSGDGIPMPSLCATMPMTSRS